MQRLRSERVERSFAHVCDTGGARRTWLCGIERVRKRRPQNGRRYNKKNVHRKRCHSFTFGLLITPSGYRVPGQIPHYSKEYRARKGLSHRTTAEAASDLIRSLPLPEEAAVVVLGDTAYEANVVRQACADRGYI